MQITLGQVLSILSGITAFIAIVAGAFKLGGLAQRVTANENIVLTRLAEMAERLEKIINVVNEISSLRTTQEQHTSELQRHRASVHDLRDALQSQETRIAVIEASTERAA